MSVSFRERFEQEVPKKKPASPATDAEDLKAWAQNYIRAMGRGGLTALANQCGMTVSAFRRRFEQPTAFDIPTIRILIFMMRLKNDQITRESGTQYGDYLFQETEGEIQWTTTE